MPICLTCRVEEDESSTQSACQTKTKNETECASHFATTPQKNYTLCRFLVGASFQSIAAAGDTVTSYSVVPLPAALKITRLAAFLWALPIAAASDTVTSYSVVPLPAAVKNHHREGQQCGGETRPGELCCHNTYYGASIRAHTLDMSDTLIQYYVK